MKTTKLLICGVAILAGALNTDSEGHAADAAISFPGSYDATDYARTLDLSTWTTAPNTLNAYDKPAEYALGGDPTSGTTVWGGTNWFEFIRLKIEQK